LRDQLERASLSVSNNIAEGCERGTHEELLTFLYYARGSCAEVRSMLRFLKEIDRPGVGHSMDPLIDLDLSTSRQLGAWLESLKNSEDNGPRYRNEATRNAKAALRRQAGFREKMRMVQEDPSLASELFPSPGTDDAPHRPADPPSEPKRG
jgi:four helix bundle protein